MHDIGIGSEGVEIYAAPRRRKNRLLEVRAVKRCACGPEPPDAQAIPGFVLFTEATDIDLNQASQSTAEIVDVHPGSAINVRRVFVGQKEDLFNHINRSIAGFQR
jgi:hypothetical protein